MTKEEALVVDEEKLELIQSSWMVKNSKFVLPGDLTDILTLIGLEKLKERWMKANSSFSNRNVVLLWWKRIRDMHSSSLRAYHTSLHLEELFGFADIFGYLGEDSMYQTLALSIFFHDAVYDAKSGTNEEDSAKLFLDYAEECGDCDDAHLVGRVVDFILATKAHSAENVQDPTSLLGLFLDMDMAVLGKDPEAYDAYAGAIRKEFIFVERDVYCKKRAEVLSAFLEKDNIYLTPTMKGALEEKARSNMRREIEMLKENVIPCEPTA